MKFVNNSGHDGVINSIKTEIIKYLKKDNELSNSIFNTIIELSRDEMDHQKFNAKYIKEKDNNFNFVPNKVPRLKGADIYIKQEKGRRYISNRNDIIKKYLFSSKKLNITQFDINNYDLGILCNISNCGRSFKDKIFYKIMKEIIKMLLEIKNDNSIKHKMDIIDTYQEREIIRLFERELNCFNQEYQNIIDLLFEGIDFSEFKNDSIEFYKEILNCFIAIYYDSYKDKSVRAAIEKRIKYIEQKVENIEDKHVKKELYKCLYLSPPRYAHWDPSKINTKYDYKDKEFLNQQLCKYGIYDIKNSMKTIYLLKIDELLPEILISVEEILKFNKKDFELEFEGDTKIIIDRIITKAFINFSDDIKEDSDLIDAYESILKILMELNYEKAGVILDEFRIH